MMLVRLLRRAAGEVHLRLVVGRNLDAAERQRVRSNYSLDLKAIDRIGSRRQETTNLGSAGIRLAPRSPVARLRKRTGQGRISLTPQWPAARRLFALDGRLHLNLVRVQVSDLRLPS
jgi:hypothetical protein